MIGDYAYLIHTRPNEEAKASAFLTSFGHTVYFPRYEKTIRHARRAVKTVKPFLPRYLFLWCAQGALWKIRDTPGVSDFVRNVDGYVVVPNKVVDELKDREIGFSGLIDMGDEPICDIEKPFRHGDALHYRDDNARLSAVFQHYVGEDRAQVFIRLFGRLSRATVPVGRLERVA